MPDRIIVPGPDAQPTTRQVNEAFRNAVQFACDLGRTYGLGLDPIKPSNRLDRNKYAHKSYTERRYVFGFGTSLRDTSLGHNDVRTGEVTVVFPAGYTNWDNADAYTRVRVAAHDRALQNLADLGMRIATV